MFGLFKKDINLSDVLNPTKKVKIQGVHFTIKKLDPLAYLQGYQILFKVFDDYKTTKKAEDFDLKKLQKTFKDVIGAGVISPKLAYKEDDDGTSIDDIINSNWTMAEELCSQILEFTHSKKKMI